MSTTGRATADPDALDAAGRAYRAAAADFGASISSFSTAATDVGDAFGQLGPSSEVLQAYVQTARQTVDALEKLRETIELTGEGLSTGARNYRAADADSTMNGGGG